MDNSLIPRAFSMSDAKRDREEKAREAERRTSARNASNTTIPAGGALDLQGDITVSGGGGIEIRDQGDIVVTSEVQNPNGDNYQITARLGNGTAGSEGIPSLDFGNTTLSDTSFATIRSVQGTDLSSWAETPLSSAACNLNAEPGYTSAIVSASGDPSGPQPGYGELYIRPSGFSVKANDGAGTTHSKVVASEGLPLVIYGASGVDIQGTLTNNGAPITGGGSGTWSDITGKPSTFPPDAHSHPISEVTDLQAQLKALTDRLNALDSQAPTEISYAAGYSSYTPNPIYRHASWIRQGNIYSLMGMVGSTAASNSMTAGTLYTIGSIPADIAPDVANVYGVIVSGAVGRTGIIYVLADGTIQFTPHQSFTGITKGQFFINLDAVWWPLERKAA